MNEPLVLGTTMLGLLAALLPRARRRLQLSLAKHRSLAGHARLARRVARWLPGYAYDEAQFFASDGAPPAVQAQRRAALERLAAVYRERYPRTLELTAETAEGLADLQFTGRYRVPFQYAPVLRQHLRAGAFVRSASGVTMTDLDGNVFYDLTGSYGVNVLGVDVYKACIAEGSARVEALGPVLGSLHPVVARNVARLKRISGLDEVSFHMSGTEAVTQAVRLARYHTRRSHVVRFCGAYHGWWEDVQPGPGNPVMPRQTYTLADLDPRTLQVLRTRRDIACVLVNPLQALHPNAPAPGDSSLVDGSRRAHFDRAAYTDWLLALRRVCSERGIVLIFDEVFVGFRLAPGGAQQYFGVQADLVTYGKTLGGGLPVGVVCGRRDLMKRFRDDRPADVCFARGTFNAHPYVMGAMDAFLDRLETPAVRAIYDGLDARWNARAERLNAMLRDAGVPVQVANLSTIWTVLYTQPGRYHWMLQYYLRKHGLALSWVGSGRLIFSLNYGADEFDAVAERFVAAAREMHADGWWWRDERVTHGSIRRSVLREVLKARR
ncbi:aminotransferase class III-fold pyridoxal phosphate-dependent enzyme [Azohydromonas sp.]|uniref:aminotransferase class III-fold pyridoxal phosphate-dependent enzyme n=1 Tax=Azohydromonas sp. TaxID=1872666 RepID=UPI002B9BD3D4|nr:aminotransferase class III-fold pyridoxal phosphate-dependent enzyme [Azohydromonas sp.]HMM84518.1 aminotransferase class III-fold pyridoxal phosphate-dependent enzyme [Azohydromonas sp.]